MDNLDLKSILPLLQQFGISPDKIGPEKLNQLMALSQHIKDPSKITPELSSQIINSLGINLAGPKPQKTVTDKKIPRNEKCPCGSSLKYKKCCGK